MSLAEAKYKYGYAGGWNISKSVYLRSSWHPEISQISADPQCESLRMWEWATIRFSRSFLYVYW